MLVNSQAITSDLLRLVAQARASRIMREAEARDKNRAGVEATSPAHKHRRPTLPEGVLTDAKEF
jgi:hypothetical protein